MVPRRIKMEMEALPTWRPSMNLWMSLMNLAFTSFRRTPLFSMMTSEETRTTIRRLCWVIDKGLRTDSELDINNGAGDGQV